MAKGNKYVDQAVENVKESFFGAAAAAAAASAAAKKKKEQEKKKKTESVVTEATFPTGAKVKIVSNADDRNGQIGTVRKHFKSRQSMLVNFSDGYIESFNEDEVVLVKEGMVSNLRKAVKSAVSKTKDDFKKAREHGKRDASIHYKVNGYRKGNKE